MALSYSVASLLRLAGSTCHGFPKAGLLHTSTVTFGKHRERGEPILSWGQNKATPWTDVAGQKHLNIVMKEVMKISKERRGHLHAPEVTAGIGTGTPEIASGDLTKSNLEIQDTQVAQTANTEMTLTEQRPLAKVPHFARFAEFREVDLDFQPSKLHCVWRVKAISGRPHWEKNIMKEFKLDVPKYEMVILKNTPEVNFKLWQVKHLIRLKPLTFPEGAPTDDNYKATLLKANGKFVYSKLLRENYNRPRGRPELEKYVILRAEHELIMRKKWLSGSLDGTLVNSVPVP